MGSNLTRALTKTNYRNIASALLIAIILFQAEKSNAIENVHIFVGQPQRLSVLQETIEGITDQLIEADDEISYELVEFDTGADDEQFLEALNSKMIILVGNRAAKSYHEFQTNHTELEAAFPIAFVVSALDVDELVNNHLFNAIGIRYEIPLVTSMVILRDLIGPKFDHAGVVYNKLFTKQITENEAFLAPENFQLSKVLIDRNDKRLKRRLAKGVKQLIKLKVDAIWTLNDTAMMTEDLMVGAWIPLLQKRPISVIVGVELLVQTKMSFANVGIFPDHYGLGAQTADLVFEIMDEGWETEDGEVFQPISIKKVFNKAVSDKKRIRYDETRLVLFDEVLE